MSTTSIGTMSSVRVIADGVSANCQWIASDFTAHTADVEWIASDFTAHTADVEWDVSKVNSASKIYVPKEALRNLLSMMTTAMNAHSRKYRSGFRLFIRNINRCLVHLEGTMKLQDLLLDLFNTVPFEDGYYHPSEKHILDQLMKDPYREWLIAFANEHPDHVGHLLRGCSDASVELIGPILYTLVRMALESESTAIRDDALCAVDQFLLCGQSPELMAILRQHVEPIPYLHKYIEALLRDHD